MRMDLSLFIREKLGSQPTWRGDCPACGRSNTFSIYKKEGKIRYGCFSTHCKVGGRLDYSPTSEEIRRLLFNASGNPGGNSSDVVSSVSSDAWLPITSSVEALEYARRYNILKPFAEDKVQLRYDPQQRRIVFLIRDAQGRVCDAAGRALKVGIKPKWFRYGKSHQPFICHGVCRERAIVVEDCASACAVYSVGDGVALLGTDMSDEAVVVLKSYKEVIVALDLDATSKALDHMAVLQAFTKTRGVILTKDLKYLSETEIRSVLCV